MNKSPWSMLESRWAMNESLGKSAWYNDYVCWHDNGEEIKAAMALLLPNRQAELKATDAEDAVEEKIKHTGMMEPMEVFLVRAQPCCTLHVIKAKSSVYHSLHTL